MSSQTRMTKTADQKILEDRQAVLSILLELTVAASGLFDPDYPFSQFLERIAERLGCVAVLCLEETRGEKRHIRLAESIGLSHASREIPLESTNLEGPLPYPELTNSNLTHWSLPILLGETKETSEVAYHLQLYFDVNRQLKHEYHGMIERLVGILKNALIHRNLYNKILEQKSLLESQSESTMEGILIVSMDRKIRFLNRRFVEMWGPQLQLERPLNTDTIDHLRQKVKNPKKLFFELDSLEENKERKTQTVLELVDGQILDCFSVPIKSNQGHLYGRGWYFKDITEIKRGERERALLLKREIKARAEAEMERKKIEKALGIRDDFISIASHELKTPITSLRLQLQLAQMELNKSEKAEPHCGFFIHKVSKMMKISEQQVERLTKLVMGLLDVSRIQAGKLSFEPQDVDLSKLLSEIVNRFTDQVLSMGIQLNVEIEPNITAFGDAFRIEQVINNLIVNAMKYGNFKPIDISLTRSHGSARIMIRDQGVGIPKEQQKKIFGKYERVVSSTNVSGLGLGLYIVRQIMKLHAGTIRVKSTPGHGSTFIVKFPLKPANVLRMTA